MVPLFGYSYNNVTGRKVGSIADLRIQDEEKRVLDEV